MCVNTVNVGECYKGLISSAIGVNRVTAGWLPSSRFSCTRSSYLISSDLILTDLYFIRTALGDPRSVTAVANWVVRCI